MTSTTFGQQDTLRAGQIAEGVNLLSAYPNPYYTDGSAVHYAYVLSGATVENATMAYYSSGDIVAQPGPDEVVEVRGGAVINNLSVYVGQLTFNNYGLAEIATNIVVSGSDPLSNEDFPVVDVDATTVINGGSATLGEVDNYGGIVNDFTVSSSLLNTRNGIDSGIRLVNGGIEEVINAKTTGASVQSGGVQMVEGTSSLALNGTVSSGGSIVATYGGVVSNTLVLSGGNVSVGYGGGSLLGTIVQAGATLLVTANGDARSGTNVSNIQLSGSATIADGTTSGLTVASGGVDTVTQRGTTSSATLLSGATEVLTNGGTATATTVSSGAVQVVSNGGSGLLTEVKAGAAEQVVGGGVLSAAHIAAGATLTDLGSAIGIGVDGTAYVSGVISGGAVNSGGVINVYGAASGVAVQGSGVLLIAGTGSANVVNAGGSEVVTGVASGTILAGGTSVVQLNGLAVAPVISANGLEQVLSGGVVSSATIMSGGTLDLADGTAATGALAFGPIGGGTLRLEDLTPLGTVLSGFVQNDVIDLAGLAYGSGGTATLGADDVLTVTENGSSITLQLSGNYTGEYFRLADDGAAGTAVVVDEVPCYCPGTLIMTDTGEVPVERLLIGDLVVTASGVARPIRWIGRRSYAGAFAASNTDVLPVVFRAGSLGGGLPRRDLWVSPLHAVLVDGALIPARLLANGVSIAQAERVDQVEYIHVELDSHDLLLAEGTAAESFVDDGSRGMFHNAAEFRMLYPDAPATPARFCAPRLEEGEAVHAAQRRLADLAAPQPGPGTLRGFLDAVDRGTVRGWARDLDDPAERVRLRVLVDGVSLGEVVADTERVDLRDHNEGDGRHGFSFTVPGGLSPDRRHVVEVVRVSDGQALRNSPAVVEPAPLLLSAAPAPALPFGGTLDHCDRDRIVGWAWQPGTDAPVALQVLDNGVPLIRVLANAFRPDLRAAGMGDGRHGFDIAVPGGLSPLSRHVLEVRRESDGAALPGTPVTIEPAGSFDPALQTAVARSLDALDAERDGEGVLSFLLAQTEQLLQRRAAAMGGARERQAWGQFRRRWGPEAERVADVPDKARPRALVVDTSLPAPGRDAGSEAVLSHMKALQSLGYAVSAVAADDLAGCDDGLTAVGIACLGLPAYASVEDVLRRHAGSFDVVYLHRAGVAGRYLQLARQYMPRARVVYSVADLHHLRMARQAAAENRPELLTASRAMRLAECTAAWSADVVVTHSAEEAATLREAVPGARVHVVPWAVPVAPPDARRPRFLDRSGLAFIGHGSHAPNADAARWLVEEVMPLVWQADPAVECLLVGSTLPERVRALARPGVTVLGHVPDLQTVFDRVRLTVAPLRFGAGVKGKVLASLAARTPCVMTPVAAEGLGLPLGLRRLVAEDAPGLAALILRLHADEALNRTASRAGAALVRRLCSEETVAEALGRAIEDQASIPGRKAG